MRLKNFILSFLFAVVLILCSYLFLDDRIAQFFNQLGISHQLGPINPSNIPDVLSEITGAIVLLAWITYTYMIIHGRYGRNREFSKYIGMTLPVAYFLKVVLQEVFGRVNPRELLFITDLHGPAWFNYTGEYSGSFPSGHMIVFTTIAAAMWHFYPRWRYLYAAFLLLLATALIVTEYHFLSDVIGGIYLALVIDGWSYRSRCAARES